MTEYDEKTKKIVEAPTDRPVKIVAGAGTGKTYTLTHRFLWLTSPDGGKRHPADILAITFTEKAADEMRSRIRGVMARTGRPSEMALNVHTFHGFGSRLLREYASRAGVSPDVKVLDEVQQRAIQRRLFRDACNGRIDVEGLRISDLAALDVKTLADLEKLCRTVIAKGKGHGWTPEGFLHGAYLLEEGFWEVLPTPGAVQDTGYGKELTDFLHGVMDARFPCRLLPAVEKESGDARRVYWKSLKKSKTDPPRLREGILELLAEQRSATETVLASAVAFWKEYDAELQRLGALDYDDLINRAGDLLKGHPEVQKDVQHRFRYLLVDEFQDTSPAQMALLRLVCTEVDCEPCGKTVPGNVTVVGDKKQAIYAWRNARKENMDEFVPCSHDETLKSLTTSRRCRDTVRELANAIGERMEPGDPELEPLKQQEQSSEVHVPEPFEAAGIAKAREKAARYIAERIQWMAGGEGGEPRPYRDIAVLLRKTSLFRELRAAFRERNIPYAFESATGLMEEPSAKDAVAYLRAVATPQDDAAWYRLLSRAPVGLSDAELVRLKAGKDSHFENTLEGSQNEGVQALLLRVHSGRALAGSERLGDFLRALPEAAGLRDAWDPDDREVWPQVLAALEAVAVQAESLQAGAGVQDLLELLDTYADDEALQMPTPPTEYAGVRVMTVHKAKGLEFPVVFVPDIATKGRADSGWVWDDDWGLIPDLSSGDSVKRVFWKWLRKRDAREDEEGRVWYVAATRAKDSLTVTGTWSPTSKEGELEGDERHAKAIEKSTLPNDFAVQAVWELATHDLEPADWNDTPRRRVRPPDAGNEPATTVHGPAALNSLTTSYSAMSAMDFCPVKAWLDHHWAWPKELLTAFEAVGERRKGDLFHLAVARWYNGLGAGLPDVVFGAADGEDIRESVRNLWAAFLESEWKHVVPEGVERAVTYRTNVDGVNVEVRGFVDLLYRDAEGRLVVCDFKTGKPSESHATQLCLYQMALTQEGEDVAEEGVVVQPDEDGLRKKPFGLGEREAAVRTVLAEYVATVSLGDVPDRPGSAPCGSCVYREACPPTTWAPEPMPPETPEPFDPEWMPAVGAMRAAGWEVDEADEVSGKLPAFVARRGGVTVWVWPPAGAPPDADGHHVESAPEDVQSIVDRLEELG